MRLAEGTPKKNKTKKKTHHHHKTTNRLEEGVSACFGGYFHKREKERERELK